MKDIVYRRCCGLDVHKDTIAACVRWSEETGEVHKEKTGDLDGTASGPPGGYGINRGVLAAGMEYSGRPFRNQAGKRSAHS